MSRPIPKSPTRAGAEAAPQQRRAAPQKSAEQQAQPGNQTAADPSAKDNDAKPSFTAPRPVARAGVHRRHRGVFISFLIAVVLPAILTAGYLFYIAKDQYSTTAGFVVRSEDSTPSSALLGGLASLSGAAGSTDADIVYEYIQSQTLVERVNKQLDLPKLFSKPDFDPVFAFDPSGSIEDLTNYWSRMVKVSYSSNSGLISLEVRAFTPEDALKIANAVISDSTDMINQLSAIAREDATRYAREDMQTALDRLKKAREALTEFRSKNMIVDPEANVQGQMGLLNSLEQQLADTSISLNLLLQTAKDSDPRIEQARRRIEVIDTLIERERRKFGMGNGLPGAPDTENNQDYSTLIGEFEKLNVDLKYAEDSYLSAQTALDTATAEAQRKSRYLATFAKPFLPQSAIYPQRILLSILIPIFLFLLWSIGVLIYYSVRDRR